MVPSLPNTRTRLKPHHEPAPSTKNATETSPWTGWRPDDPATAQPLRDVGDPPGGDRELLGPGHRPLRGSEDDERGPHRESPHWAGRQESAHHRRRAAPARAP